MRLREFATDDTTRNEVAALMTVLQHYSARGGANSEIAFKDISAAMNQAGFNFNYDMFNDLITSTPSLNNMISTHDQNHIKLGTKGPTAGSPEDNQSTVNSMASKAAGSAINK
jgi:hypothetical protein